MFTNANFTIASSAGSFFIPCIIMIALYATVFRKLRQRHQELMAKMHKKELLMSNRQTLLEPDHTQVYSSFSNFRVTFFRIQFHEFVFKTVNNFTTRWET